ncbi:hypothetical protein Aduo_001898 [Ancylostoma duodenale]
MPEKRAKVRVEHPQKLFYEKLLRAWRENIDDKNQKFVIYKAYTHLKNYPLEVRTITDLRQIYGIGETLAVRCYSAWEAASSAYSPSPDLKTIKKLSNEELISFMDATKRRKNAAIPSGSYGKIPTSQSGESSSREVLADKICNDEEPATHSINKNGASTASTSSSEELSSDNICYVSCQPSDQAEVVLIADVRENHGSMRANTVVEYLTSSSHRVETRALSVGDYLWILRKIDGTEMVLDWA